MFGSAGSYPAVVPVNGSVCPRIVALLLHIQHNIALQPANGNAFQQLALHHLKS